MRPARSRTSTKQLMFGFEPESMVLMGQKLLLERHIASLQGQMLDMRVRAARGEMPLEPTPPLPLDGRAEWGAGGRTESEEVGGSALFYSPLVAASKLPRNLWYVPAELPTSVYRGDCSATSARRYYGGTGAETANGLWTLFDAANNDAANNDAAVLDGMPKPPRLVRTLLDVAVEQAYSHPFMYTDGGPPNVSIGQLQATDLLEDTDLLEEMQIDTTQQLQYYSGRESPANTLPEALPPRGSLLEHLGGRIRVQRACPLPETLTAKRRKRHRPEDRAEPPKKKAVITGTKIDRLSDEQVFALFKAFKCQTASKKEIVAGDLGFTTSMENLTNILGLRSRVKVTYKLWDAVDMEEYLRLSKQENNRCKGCDRLQKKRKLGWLCNHTRGTLAKDLARAQEYIRIVPLVAGAVEYTSTPTDYMSHSGSQRKKRSDAVPAVTVVSPSLSFDVETLLADTL